MTGLRQALGAGALELRSKPASQVLRRGYRRAALLRSARSSSVLGGVPAPRTGFAGCAPLTRFAGARAPRLLGWVTRSALVAVLSGCVVTTYEGAGEPPRVPPPPQLPNSAKASSHNASDDDESFAEAPAKNEDKIAARHLLVQYRGSMRASPGIVRTKEEARHRTEEALARAKAGEDFAALVKEYSDEPGAGDRGGDLGRFERRQMVKAFADAAFALEVGAISDVIETPFGFHVIQRTE